MCYFSPFNHLCPMQKNLPFLYLFLVRAKEGTRFILCLVIQMINRNSLHDQADTSSNLVESERERVTHKDQA